MIKSTLKAGTMKPILGGLSAAQLARSISGAGLLEEGGSGLGLGLGGGGRGREGSKMKNLKLSPDSEGIPSRKSMISNLQTTKFDVLVIGGGCTGAGVALDATLRGLKVACLDRDDFGAETSGKSTKLIWGGSRYLANALASLLNTDLRLLKRPKETLHSFWSECKMVLDCHRERRFMLHEQPHLTNWIPLVVPFRNWFTWPPPFNFPLAAVGPLGLFPVFFKIYDMMSGFSCPHSHVIFPTTLGKCVPQLDSENIKYSSVFYEGQHNDSRTNLAVALTAGKYGATMCNYCEVVRLLKSADGKLCGAVLRDTISGEDLEVEAQAVVFCGGPFSDELRRLDNPTSQKIVMGAGGTHIVLSKRFLPDNYGVLDMNTSDGRFLFILPWQDHVLIGTTDRKMDATRGPLPQDEEIRWLVKESGKFFKNEFKPTRDDVLSAWCGIRPLVLDPAHMGSNEMMSRDHLVYYDKVSKSVLVAGGKWTTFRHMAEDAVNEVVLHFNFPLAKPCQTLKTKYVGFEGYSHNLAEILVKECCIPHRLASHLVKTYGGRSRDVLQVAESMEGGFQQLVEGSELYPHIAAEVVYAARFEWAVRASDIIGRRTRLAFLDKEVATKTVDTVVKLLAAELDWDEQRIMLETTKTAEYLLQFGGRL